MKSSFGLMYCHYQKRQRSLDGFLTTKEVANRCRVTRMTVRNWCVSLDIGIKVAGKWWIDPKKLDQMLQGYYAYLDYKKVCEGKEPKKIKYPGRRGRPRKNQSLPQQQEGSINNESEKEENRTIAEEEGDQRNC